MSSTNKTDLGFNKWVLSDKPTMYDFNADNALTDELLQAQSETIDRVAQETKALADSTVDGVRTMYDLVRYSSTVEETGVIKIGFPTGFTETVYHLDIVGTTFSQNGAWSIKVGGLASLSSQSWTNRSAVSSGNAPHDAVRFGVDSAGKCCLVLGAVGSVWSSPVLELARVQASYITEPLTAEGWSIVITPDVSDITFFGDSIFSNTAPPFTSYQPWHDATPLLNGVTGSVRYIKIGQEVTVQGTGVVRNTAAGTVIAFVMPAGYRPKFNYATTRCHSSDGTGVMATVASNGNLFFDNSTAGSTLSANAKYWFYLKYIAEQ